MGHRRVGAIGALVAALLVAGCGGAAEETAEAPKPPALSLPDVSSLMRVQTSTNDRESFVLSSPEEFAALLEVLASLEPGWEPKTEANPPFHYAAGLVGLDKRPIVVFWIGEDWVGANDMQQRPNVWQPLVDPERARLLRSLGVDPVPEASTP